MDTNTTTDLTNPSTKTQREIWDEWAPPDNVLDAVRLLFEILDGYEISDNDVAFRPTYIGSCRVWDTHRLNRLLPKIREMFDIEPPTDLRKLNQEREDD
jgi:hypothetical protein